MQNCNKNSQGSWQNICQDSLFNGPPWNDTRLCVLEPHLHGFLSFYFRDVCAAGTWPLASLLVVFPVTIRMPSLYITLHTGHTTNVWVHSRIVVDYLLPFNAKILLLLLITMDDLLSFRPLLFLLLFSYACALYFILISPHFNSLLSPKSLQLSFHVLLENLFHAIQYWQTHALKQGDIRMVKNSDCSSW